MTQKLIYWEVLSKMTVEKLDKLPGPVEFRYRKYRPKKGGDLIRTRKRYVGIGWVDEGEPLGDEPILVMERGSPDIPEGIEMYEGGGACSSV